MLAGSLKDLHVLLEFFIDIFIFCVKIKQLSYQTPKK
jgi:hypothetical protein